MTPKTPEKDNKIYYCKPLDNSLPFIFTEFEQHILILNVNGTSAIDKIVCS